MIFKKDLTMEKLWSAQYICLIIVNTLDASCFYMINPTIADYTLQLGGSIAVAGFIAGMFALTSLFVRPFSGPIADRLDCKWLLLCTLTVMGLCTFCYSIAPGYQLLIFFRILHGVTFALNMTAGLVLVSKAIPRSRMNEGIGYYGLGQTLAIAIAPSIGLFLGEQFGYATGYKITALVQITAAAVVLIFIKSVKPQPREKKKITLNDIIAKDALGFAALGSLFFLSTGIINAYIALVGTDRSIESIGLYFTINAIVMVVVRPLSGKLSDKLPIHFIVIPALICTALALIFVGISHSIWVVMLAAVMMGIGIGAGQPTLLGSSIKKLPPEKSGVASSTFYLGGDIAQGISPMIGGVLLSWSNNNYTLTYIVFAGIITASLVVYLIILFPKLKKTKDVLENNPSKK